MLAVISVVITSVLPVTGCGTDGASAPIATLRDSAGVEIVENRWAPEEVSAGWGVDSRPLLEIGVVEGDEALQLFNVTGGAVLSDGRIALVNAGTHELRIFTAEGVPDTVFGGEGDGPGEFRGASLAGVRADTLYLYDTTLRRATLWHPKAGIVREFGVGGEGGGFPVPRGMFADGSIVFGGGISFSSQEGFPSGLIRLPSRYSSVTATGRPSAEFGEFPGSEMFARVANGGFTASSIPFARITNTAVGDSTLFLGLQDGPEILVFHRDGSLRRIIRFDRPRLEVTADLRSRYIDARLADAEDEDDRRRLRQSFEEVPFGERVPPYGAMAVDALGCLWVSDAALPGADVTPWSIFDPSGRLAGRLGLPSGIRLLVIERDRLLVRETDDLGIERVRLLRLSRPG